VLLDFWATWCTPCRAELPYVRKAYERFRQQPFDVIGVSLDAFQRVPATRLAAFVQEQQMPWPQIYSEGPAIAATYGVSAIPAVFLISGDTGAILASGDDLRDEALLQTIDRHLKGAVRQ